MEKLKNIILERENFQMTIMKRRTLKMDKSENRKTEEGQRSNLEKDKYEKERN